MDVQCPRCSQLVEKAQVLAANGRDTVDGFRCPSCNYEWALRTDAPVELPQAEADRGSDVYAKMPGGLAPPPLEAPPSVEVKVEAEAPERDVAAEEAEANAEGRRQTKGKK